LKDAARVGARFVTGGHEVGHAGDIFAPTVVEDVPRARVSSPSRPSVPVAQVVTFDAPDTF